jgi:hypothetical protein
LKDQIPILDDEYFERKRIQQEFENNRRMWTLHHESMNRRYGLGLTLKDRVWALCGTYFQTESMTAEQFETELDARIAQHENELCPFTHYSKPEEKKKEPVTVGKVLNAATWWLFLVLFGFGVYYGVYTLIR